MSWRKPIWGSHQVWWNISRFVWEYVMNFWQEENRSEYIQIFGKNNNCLIWNIHCHFGVSVTYWYSGIFEGIDTKFEVTVVASDSLTSPKNRGIAYPISLFYQGDKNQWWDTVKPNAKTLTQLSTFMNKSLESDEPTFSNTMQPLMSQQGLCC